MTDQLPKKQRKKKIVKIKPDKYQDLLVLKKRAKFIPGECCNLCVDPLSLTDPYLNTVTSCNHVFHRFCLTKWLRTCKKNGRKLTCPNCRKELNVTITKPKTEEEEEKD